MTSYDICLSLTLLSLTISRSIHVAAINNFYLRVEIICFFFFFGTTRKYYYIEFGKHIKWQFGVSSAFNVLNTFFFLAVTRSMKDLSSLTRDQTHAPCVGSKES